MSFLSVLETIGKDVLKGVEAASPIIGTFVPAAGPILTEIAAVITALENKTSGTTTGTTITADDLSKIIQILATAHSVKQSVGATPETATPKT